MSAGRLIGHPGGVDLGPTDAHEWLCGFLYAEPTQAQREALEPLAGRIQAHEERAVDVLAPDAGDADWPQEARQRDGVVLHQLGRHEAAARWGVRQATARGWRRYRNVPSRSARKQEMEKLRKAAIALSNQLRKLSPHSLMALQQSAPDDRLFVAEAPSNRKPGTRFIARLPARPHLDGKGAFQRMLEGVIAAADADLHRLASIGTAYRWPDWTAGSTENVHVTLAHEAVPLWLHFRADRRPSKSIGSRSFSELAEIMHEIATGEASRDMRRDVHAALLYYSDAISSRYP